MYGNICVILCQSIHILFFIILFTDPYKQKEMPRFDPEHFCYSTFPPNQSMERPLRKR